MILCVCVCAHTHTRNKYHQLVPADVVFSFIHRSDILIEKVHLQWRIPSTGQVLFSRSSSHYISPNESISHDQFVELLEHAGGSKGHAKLYLLPVQQLQQTMVEPDTSCFSLLSEFHRLLFSTRVWPLLCSLLLL